MQTLSPPLEKKEPEEVRQVIQDQQIEGRNWIIKIQQSISVSLNIVPWTLHLPHPNASSNPQFSSNHTALHLLSISFSSNHTALHLLSTSFRKVGSLTAFGSSEMISCTLYPVARYFVETGEWFKMSSPACCWRMGSSQWDSK